MIKYLPPRGVDDYGSGAYGASRGKRKHRGVDFACYPDTLIASPVSGFVTKLGYAYSDDLSYRYVEVTDDTGLQHRIFYLKPLVYIRGFVEADKTILGSAQNIQKRYSSGMINHIHYEIKKENVYLDPRLYIDKWA